MDETVQYIRPFVDVTLSTFKEFVGCDVTPRHPHFLLIDNMDEWNITSIIGLSGAIRGAVIISMKTDLALKFTDLLVGTKHTEIDSDVVDAIGEIVNIIAGNCKPMMPDGNRIIISIPTVIKGKAHSVAQLSKKARVLCIPFKAFDNDIFNILVAIEVETPVL